MGGAARPGLDPGHEMTCRMRTLFRVRKATRLGGVVDDARPREVRRSCAVDERRRATVAGASGAEREGRRNVRQAALGTPSRVGVNAGLVRVRTAASLQKKEQLTALLHHVSSALRR
jgi:hypothetical protein